MLSVWYVFLVSQLVLHRVWDDAFFILGKWSHTFCREISDGLADCCMYVHVHVSFLLYSWWFPRPPPLITFYFFFSWLFVRRFIKFELSSCWIFCIVNFSHLPLQQKFICLLIYFINPMQMQTHLSKKSQIQFLFDILMLNCSKEISKICIVFVKNHFWSNF